ncbi:hypothetical protein ANCCAN_00993 [Ancylostoma caninum]|uniref:SCP domain-containing protein n=1 Tax=Ancylostoma caninum TaxID=29170 RepID=A0A368H8W7_ANCCA|nr:hypothetical protein ANCCAN_00993 [Ancylostoma caninum]
MLTIFYLLPIAYAAEASKHVPECHTKGGVSGRNDNQRRLYNEIVAGTKRHDMKYDCGLENIARHIAIEGLRKVPEQYVLYSEGGRKAMNERQILDKVVAGWKSKRQLQKMGNKAEVGCYLWLTRSNWQPIQNLYRVACVFL